MSKKNRHTEEIIMLDSEEDVTEQISETEASPSEDTVSEAANKKAEQTVEKLKKKPWLKWYYIVPVAGIIVGLIIFLTPFVLRLGNSVRNSVAVSSMSDTFSLYDENDPEIIELKEQAKAYNEMLAGTYTGDTDKIWSYDKQLSFNGSATMSTITIPKLNVKLAIYHGSTDDVLSSGAGHLERTSLPIGGESTHTVITAHSGMKEIYAFDNLDQLEEGDEFTLTTLGKDYTYVVTDIETVLPDETESLGIVQGKDLSTLITCTPYGINDHRLLVHAERVADGDKEETTEAEETDEGIDGLPLGIANATVYTEQEEENDEN